MVATPSKLVAFAAVTTYCMLATVYASPLESNPTTPIGDSAPLTVSHPAYGGPLRGHVVEAIIKDAEVSAVANSLTITNSSAVEVATGARRHLEGAAEDMAKIKAHFGKDLEVNYKTLMEKYSSASAKTIPWPASYWPVYQDSINARWKANEPSPAEKYATALKKNVKQFTDNVSLINGIDQFTRSDFTGSKVKCSKKEDCASGTACGIREGKQSGYCIPTWWGICHAWAPASNWEPEPKCDVVKNGVTFHPVDLKGLITAVYDGAEIETVFTGSRFNGPDSPANKDQYGRYTDSFRRDLGPGFFHIAIANIMGINKHSFVVDVTAGAEVWNQPVRSYKVLKSEIMDVKKASKQYFGTEKYPFNGKVEHLAYTKLHFEWIVESYDDGALIPSRANEFTRFAEYEYFLELDASFNIIGGEWLGNSRYEHPDFLWFAKSTPKKDAVTALGLSYKEVRALIDESVACKSTPTPEPTTVAPTTAPPTDEPVTTTPAPSTDKPSTSKPTTTPETSKPSDGKPTEAPVTSKPSNGKPTDAPSTTTPSNGKPTTTPETTKPSKDKPTDAPTPTSAQPGGNGKPTQTPETTKPSKDKPTTTPETSKPSKDKPTDAPATTPPADKPTNAPPGGNGKPTDVPATTVPAGKPTDAPATTAPAGKPTDAPATTAPAGKPTDVPATTAPAGKPTDAPATTAPAGKPTDAPATTAPAGKPTDAPATTAPAGKPTDAPATTAPAGKPTDAPATTAPAGRPTETPATTAPAGKPTDAPPSGNGKPSETPAPEGPGTIRPVEPTPEPETSKPAGKPTTPTEPSAPATVKPVGGDDVSPTPTPSSPSSGASQPTPAPSTPDDESSDDDDDDVPPSPTTVAPASGGKPTPPSENTPSSGGKPTPPSENTPSPTVKPAKKPKNCHA